MHALEQRWYIIALFFVVQRNGGTNNCKDTNMKMQKHYPVGNHVMLFFRLIKHVVYPFTCSFKYFQIRRTVRITARTNSQFGVTRKSRGVLLGVKLPHHAMVTIMQTPTAVQNENNTLVAKKNTQCFGNRTIEYCIKHSSSGPRLCGTKKLILDIEAVAQAWLVQIQSVIFYLVQSLSLLSFLLYSPFHLLYYLFSLRSLICLLSSIFSLLNFYIISYLFSLIFCLLSLLLCIFSYSWILPLSS